ncbi:MAG TPA: hypothetical protein VK324_13835 [Tepidisphaeraceae bacterium]|nr:hypothetical protein [Tepidisphaeraceae bacterium]
MYLVAQALLTRKYDPFLVPHSVVISSEGTASAVESHKNVTVHSPAVTDSVFKLEAGGGTVTNLTPGVIELSGNVATRLANGIAGLALAKNGITRLLTFYVSRSSGVTTKLFNSYAAGTLERAADDACRAALDSAITAGLSPAQCLPLFSNLAARTVNPDHWLRRVGYDCSGISATNPGSCLVDNGTRKFVVGVEHYPPAHPVMVGSDGPVNGRNIIWSTSIGPANSADGYASDIHVCELDVAMPATVAAYKLLPADAESYLPGLAGNPFAGVHAVGGDQEKKLHPRTLIGLGASASFGSPDAAYAPFTESVISGDSGSTAFLVLDDADGKHLVAVTGWTSGGTGSGSDWGDYLTEINAALASRGAPPVMTKNLSAYPS